MVFQYIFNVLNNKVQIQMQFKMAAAIVNGGGGADKVGVFFLKYLNATFVKH